MFLAGLSMDRVLVAMRAVLPPFKSTGLQITSLRYRVVSTTADLALEGNAIPRHGDSMQSRRIQRLLGFREFPILLGHNGKKQTDAR